MLAHTLHFLFQWVYKYASHSYHNNKMTKTVCLHSYCENDTVKISAKLLDEKMFGNNILLV